MNEYLIGAAKDETTGVVWGRAGNEYTYIIGCHERKNYAITMCVSNNGIAPAKGFFRELIMAANPVSDVMVSGFRIVFILNVRKNSREENQQILAALQSIFRYLAIRGWRNCSEDSGMPSQTSVCNIHGHIVLLNDRAYQVLRVREAADRPVKKKNEDNLIGGIVGAFLGSLAGVLAIVAFGQANMVAAISGLVMGIAAAFGYKLLGGAMTRRGIVITVIICLIMTYVGERMDWAVFLANEVDASISYCFMMIPKIVRLGYIEPSNYYGNILQVYLFTGLGLLSGLCRVAQKMTIKDEVRMFKMK